MKRLLPMGIVLGALLCGVSAPAFATTISLTDSWSAGTATHKTGTLPTLSLAKQDTSNAGNNIQPLTNSFTQTLTTGTATMNEYLFVAVPQGNIVNSAVNSAIIPINFNLHDGGTGTATFTAYLNYFASFYTNTDTMAWTSTAPSSAGQTSSGTFSQTVTLSDGAAVKITLPWETDWNMAQGITFMDTAIPTQQQVSTPEPASLAVLGVGAAGLGFLRNKRRNILA